MRSEKISKGKKIASIIGIIVAAALIIVAFSGRFCNTESADGFMHFANFFVGAFGMAFYGIMAAVIVVCACTLAGKTVKMPAKYIVHFILLFVAIVLFVHMLTTTYLPMEFKSHMSYLYHYYDSDLSVPSFGGVVFGLIAWALKRALSIWGASIIIFALLAWTTYVAGDFFYKCSTGKLLLMSKSTKSDIEPSQTTAEVNDKPVFNEQEKRKKDAIGILFYGAELEQSAKPEVVSSNDTTPGAFDYADRSEIKNKPTKEEAKDLLFNGEQSGKNSGGNSFFDKDETAKTEENYIVKGYFPKAKQTEEKSDEKRSDWKIATVPAEKEMKAVESRPSDVNDVFVQQPGTAQVKQADDLQSDNFEEDDVDITDVTFDDYIDEDEDDYIEQTVYIPQVVEVETKEEPKVEPKEEIVVVQPKQVEYAQEKKSVDEVSQTDPDEVVIVKGYDEVDGGLQERFDVVPKRELENAKNTVHQYMEYNIPPIDLLNDVTIVEDHDDDERQRLAQAIVNKLAVFNIKIELADIIVGPSVTRYMFTVLSQKTRMSDFKQYSDDIKACVEAKDDIIINAPVKGTNMVGVEVPNKVKRTVVLREILESDEFKNTKGELIFAIGQEITGQVVVSDLAKMPHLLIAGTTGSGKSVCLNCLIVSLMYKYGPEYLRFVMVDPKFVELSRYTGIPHMLTAKTITAMADALAAMDYLIAEMEARYQLFVFEGVDKISEYNKHINPKLKQKMPYLIFIVDELADLMSTNKSAFEQKLIRLAQKGRACGIHVVLATQRPDTKVITGTIKGNLPCRMALKVSSSYDSQTIIGCGGAEKLLGYGDMLFMSPTVAGQTRIQGAYIDNDEIKALVKYSADANEVYYDNSVNDQIFVAEKEAKKREDEENSSDDDGDKDELYPFYKKALRYWLERNNGKASISSLQRGIGVGFNRAGRIMENLQKMGYVEEPASSDTSNRALKVLVTLEELDMLFPDDGKD